MVYSIDLEYIMEIMRNEGYEEIDTDPMEDWYYHQLLAARSALEFARPELDAGTLNLLNVCDAHWKANPKDFNAFFLYGHARKDTKEDLDGWVEDEQGQYPTTPKAHWWWWPIEEDGTH